MNTEIHTTIELKTSDRALTISQELKEIIEQRIKISLEKSEEITNQLHESLI